MSRRVWWWRVAAAVGVYAGAETGLVLLGTDPDPVRLALIVALLGGAAALVVDSATVGSTPWPLHQILRTGLGRADPRTAAYLSLVESHLTATLPDAALRDRLRELTDQALRIRHDLTVDDPRAEDLVGPELGAVLAGGPRRLGAGELERCVGRIEAI